MAALVLGSFPFGPLPFLLVPSARLLRFDNTRMRSSHAWFSEHTAEDVVRAHRTGTAVYVVSKGIALSTCLEFLLTNETEHLLIRECPHLWWLRAEDALRMAYLDEGNADVQADCDSDDSNGFTTVTMSSLTAQDCTLHPVPMVRPSQCIKSILQECRLSLPLAVVGEECAFVNEGRGIDGDGGAFTDHDHVMGIVTAEDLLHYLYLYGYHLNYLMSRPARDIACLEPVETVPYSSPAEYCLGRVIEGVENELSMNEAGAVHRVIGVVDSKGMLMTSLSLNSFLRYTIKSPLSSSSTNNNNNTTFASLDLPIITFLRTQSNAWPPVRFNERHTFGETLKRILESPDHVLWRMDEHGRPRGLVTLHHFLDYIRRQLPGQKDLSLCP